MRRLAHTLLAVCLLRSDAGASAAQPMASPEPGSVAVPEFVVRADPALAEVINAVLARIALPVEGAPGKEVTADDLQSRCGGHAPIVADASDAGAEKTGFAPCLRIRRNAKITASSGDTIERIALRNGLPALAADGIKAVRIDESGVSRPVNPKDLRPGDIVTVPELPLWTSIVARPGAIDDRSDVIAALSAALKCGSEPAEKCLRRKNVFVLDHFIRRLQRLLRTRVPRPGQSPRPIRDLGRILTLDTGAVSASASALAWEPASIKVAPEQWPYDAALLGAILSAPSTKLRTKAVIGVADGGLATAGGAPLPDVIFDRNLDDPTDPPEHKDVDDDENGYVDDIIGGGTKRGREIDPTGDVGLCMSDLPDFSTWDAAPKASASHGAVVASIAAGLRIRTVAPATPHLPTIAFFRMLGDVCTPDGEFSVDPGSLAFALGYLEKRSDVINISYTIDGKDRTQFLNSVGPTIGNGEKVVVISAGNDSPKNLDKNSRCPACLGDPDTSGHRTANRALIVGAATSDLRVSPFSNFGYRTVGLYAPGEPTDAIDIAGKDASKLDPSTSYAAPYAALAVGLLRSHGLVHPLDLRDRLAAASWPLEGIEVPPGVGVVDLVRVAAVNHHAVEVIEDDADGKVRRTYVGKLVENLRDVNLCNASYSEGAVQAIRLADEAGGSRVLSFYMRKVREDGGLQNNRRHIRVIPGCRPTGTIHLQSLLQGDKEFDLANVSQILLPWR